MKKEQVFKQYNCMLLIIKQEKYNLELLYCYLQLTHLLYKPGLYT